MSDPHTTSESVADVAIGWLEIIHRETLRDEPDLAERVRAGCATAAHHIRIKEITNGK